MFIPIVPISALKEPNRVTVIIRIDINFCITITTIIKICFYDYSTIKHLKFYEINTRKNRGSSLVLLNENKSDDLILQ